MATGLHGKDRFWFPEAAIKCLPVEDRAIAVIWSKAPPPPAAQMPLPGTPFAIEVENGSLRYDHEKGCWCSADLGAMLTGLGAMPRGLGAMPRGAPSWAKPVRECAEPPFWEQQEVPPRGPPERAHAVNHLAYQYAVGPPVRKRAKQPPPSPREMSVYDSGGGAPSREMSVYGSCGGVASGCVQRYDPFGGRLDDD